MTEQGQKQGLLTALAFENVKDITAIYTSPLKRTYQTATIIAQKVRVPLITDRKLLEINHGTWEGKRPDQFNQTEQQILNQWKSQPDVVQMPDGEHFNDVASRAEKFLLKIEKSKGKNIIVSHDLTIRVMIALIKNLSFDNIWSINLDNCGITTIGLNDREIIDLNNTTHLDGLRSELNRQAL